MFFLILSLARGHRENLSNREKSNVKPSDLFAFMLYHGARLLPSNSFALRWVLCSSVVEHRSTVLGLFPHGHSSWAFRFILWPRLYEYPKKNETKQRMPFLNSYGGMFVLIDSLTSFSSMFYRRQVQTHQEHFVIESKQTKVGNIENGIGKDIKRSTINSCSW